VRVGTRGSALALAQAQQVADEIDGAQLVVIQTSGDAGAAPGEKARWVDAIERALLDGEIDLAVHSAKDVPAELAEGLALVGCPARADPYDALCGATYGEQAERVIEIGFAARFRSQPHPPSTPRSYAR